MIIKPGLKNLSPIVKCPYYTLMSCKQTWKGPTKDNNAVSFSGVVTNLSNTESNKIFLSAKASIFLTAAFVWSNYSMQDINMSFIYWLIRYPTYSFFYSNRWMSSFRTFFCIINILSISSWMGKTLCTYLSISTWLCNSCGSWKVTYVVFGIFQISYLLDVENFLQNLYWCHVLVSQYL